jgi:cell division protein FtsB
MPKGSRPGTRWDSVIKTKKAGLLTKLLVFALLVYSIGALWNLNARIISAKEEVQVLKQQVEAQGQHNTELSEAIENSDDPDHRKDIARQKLGLLEPGEKVFYITD